MARDPGGNFPKKRGKRKRGPGPLPGESGRIIKAVRSSPTPTLVGRAARAIERLDPGPQRSLVRGEDPRGKHGARVPSPNVTGSFGAGRRIPKAGSGSSAVSNTVPRHARTATAKKPRTIAQPTVAQKERAKAKRSQQPSRQPGAAAARARASVLPGPAPTHGYPALPTAAELARAEYAPAFTDLDLEGQRNRAAAEARQRAVQGFTEALMRQLGGLAPGVAADFQQAATQTQGIAQAAADQLRASGGTASAPAASDMAAIGAPAAQQAQLEKTVADVYGQGAGALFYTGGAMPAQSLLGEGARQTAFARQLPAFAALSGQQNFRQALYDENQQREELASRRAATMREMGARVPAYELQLATEKARRVDQQRAELAARAELKVKSEAAAANEAYLRWQMGMKTQDQQFDQAATVSRIQNEQARIKLQSIQADRSWNATLRRLGISEANLKLSAAKAEMLYQQRGKKGGLTATQVQRLANQATDIAADFYNGVQDVDGNVIQEPLATNPNGYQDAMSDLLSRGIPLTVAQRALNRWWRTPGRYGRPKVPFQLRKKK